MRSGIKSHLSKLEAAAGEPPSLFEDMTADELRAYIIEKGESLLACDDISEEHRAWVKQVFIAHTSSNGVVDWDALRRVAAPSDLLRPKGRNGCN
jgi:hypothetical protein